MTDIYRVTVERLTPDADGDLIGTPVLELMGPGTMLARFAPGGVAEVLGAERAAVTVVMPSDVPHVQAEPIGGMAPVYTPTSQPVPTAEDKPKRKRRTRAEIAADEAAAAAAVNGSGPTGDGDADLAAAVAEVEAEDRADSATEVTGSYMTPEGPVVADAAGPLPADEPTTAPPASSVPAAVAPPFNPFAPQ